ncbi:MAG: hypothetical protein D6800_14655, partial [Candidatus Zixiibacteriota bacterium]
MLRAEVPLYDGSGDLLGYNIFRETDGGSEFLFFVPAHLTEFVDEFTAPNATVTYRVTAVYVQGESQAATATGQASAAISNGLFDKIVIAANGRSQAATWADYNADGFLDMLVVNFFNQDNAVYQNSGGSALSPISLPPVSADQGFSYSASWADFDNDDRIDLFIANGFHGAGQRFGG